MVRTGHDRQRLPPSRTGPPQTNGCLGERTRVRDAVPVRRRRERPDELGVGNRAGAPRVAGLDAGRGSETGQGLVEFVLVFPILVVLLMGFIEFAFAFNALLSMNYATRNGALVAAEAGNSPGADCFVLNNVDASVGAPANASNITQVQIFWTDANGAPLDTSGALWSPGDGTPRAANTYVRSSAAQTCPDSADSPSIFYTRTANNYPLAARCNDILGSLAACQTGHATLDEIGVEVTYNDAWKTPLANLVGLSGTGFTLVQANEMRMEPVI
jgi:Flp pilus assembly protein TadG